MKKTILILTDDIWSMGKNKGVPSFHRLIMGMQGIFNCTIFTTDDSQSSLDSYPMTVFKKLTVQSNNRYLVYVVNQINYVLITFKYIWKAIKLNERPSIIYCNSALPVLSSWLLSRLFNAKVIHRIYGTFLYDKLSSKYSLLKKYQEVLSFIVPADKYIITNDGTYGDEVAEYFKIPKEKIIFLRNGVVKVERCNSMSLRQKILKDFNLPLEAFIVLSVSRLANWKRVDRTINAMNLIEDTNIYAIILGDGPMMESYKRLAQNPNIIFIGAKTQTEVREFMSAADLFISMYDVSNVGNPLLEAMSAGLPIITYDTGDTASVINGHNGTLIKKGSEDSVIGELKKSILNIKQNDVERHLLAEGARKYANQELMTWDERITLEIKIISEMCHEK